MNQRVIGSVHEQQRHVDLQHRAKPSDTWGRAEAAEEEEEEPYVVDVMDTALLLVVLFERAVAVELPVERPKQQASLPYPSGQTLTLTMAGRLTS